MRYFLVIIFVTLVHSSRAQTDDDLDIRIHGMTTMVKSELAGRSKNASGFFFIKYDTVRKDNPRRVKEIWLVTNRHAVVFQDTKNTEHLASSFTFNLRSVLNDSLYWNPITINRDALRQSIRLSKDASIDVVAISVTNLINKKFATDRSLSNLLYGVSDDVLPSLDTTVTPQVSDDVIVIGYPSGFYDRKNLFPIVKTGIIASRWGLGFNGGLYFLIDSKLFPQSSGSLVLSKPTNYMTKKGHSYFNNNKQFTFLGVYSGEPVNIETDLDSPTVKIEKYDLGVVWYYTVVKFIIDKGQPWID